MVTAGGAMIGYCEIGRRVIDMMPAMLMISAMTQATIGRSMKKRDSDMGGVPSAGRGCRSRRGGRRWRAARFAGLHRHSRLHLLQALDDQAVARVQAVLHEPLIAHRARH